MNETYPSFPGTLGLEKKYTETTFQECDVEKGVPDDLPAEPQEGCTTEGTLDLVVKGDLEFCRPSSGKCFAQQEEREAVNRKSQKSSRITRGGTEERRGQGQEIAALHFILEATENQKRISGLRVTESVSWEGYLRSSLGMHWAGNDSSKP